MIQNKGPSLVKEVTPLLKNQIVILKDLVTHPHTCASVLQQLEPKHHQSYSITDAIADNVSELYKVNTNNISGLCVISLLFFVSCLGAGDCT